MMYFKKLIKIYFFIIFFGLLLLSIFNYKIDSLSIFRTSDTLLTAVKYINSGYGVRGLENINDRLLQKVIVQNTDKPLDTIVIGSSRIMYLAPEYIGNEKNILDRKSVV